MLDIDKVDDSLVNWFSKSFKINQPFEFISKSEAHEVNGRIVYMSINFILSFYKNGEIHLTKRSNLDKSIELLTFDSAYELAARGIINKKMFKELVIIVIRSNFAANRIEILGGITINASDNERINNFLDNCLG